jgi:3-methyladenine DNA glycosylase/8-oxoguanine DNA glycosylase
LAITAGDDPWQPELSVEIQHDFTLTESHIEQLLTGIRHMLRLDEQFEAFYELCRQNGAPWEQLSEGKGRLLRSPTIFEDLLKTICTTNIQWGGTKRMVENLVNEFGEPAGADPNYRAFPTAEALCAVTPQKFAERVNLGYRSRYVYELAEKIVSGEIDLSPERIAEMPTEELRKFFLGIKGIGNYAVATLLMLLGRYDALPIDSVFRQFVAQKYFAGQYPGDQQAAQIYASWGEWRYLAYWFDLWNGPEENV